MKVRLLFPDHDAELDAAPAPGADDLIADLDLAPVLALMQLPDRGLADVVPSVLLNPVTDPAVIDWRQRVLVDAMTDAEVVTGLFDLAGRAIEAQRSVWMFGGHSADSLLPKALYGFESVLPTLAELARFAAAHLPRVASPGLTGLLARLRDDLSPGYLDELQRVVGQLRFPDGLVSATAVGPDGLLGHLELLIPPQPTKPRWLRGLARPGKARFVLPERDEAVPGRWSSCAAMRCGRSRSARAERWTS